MKNYYCLKCFTPNNCKCGTRDYCFTVSPKLRVPVSIKNKERFRQFLDNCPIFPNCVPDHLREDFRNLLRRVKYYDKIINGHTWTLVPK